MPLKQITRRRRRTKKPIDVQSRIYLGSGSYGSIYEIPDTNLALKEHRIFNMDNFALCENWKHEYKIQLAAYNICNPVLAKYRTRIVQPYEFMFASKGAPQEEAKHADACLFTMDRIPGLSDAPRCASNKIMSILRHDAHLSRASIPPYLNLGSLTLLTGHITLDMLQGAQRVDFPNEAYSYCLADGVALHLLQSMFLSFLTIADAGFIPRDIEFVFDGSCGSAYIAVLDFNEVKTIAERSAWRPAYDLEIDLAHVYIDLCGLRSSRDVNPEAPYDGPTPQWKFLCSPLVSPYAFFACIGAAQAAQFKTFDFDRVVAEITRYVETRHLRTTGTQSWMPSDSEFASVEYIDFDKKLQSHFIGALMDTVVRRNIVVNKTYFASLNYKEALQYLKTLCAGNKQILTNNEDWDSMWEIQDSTQRANKSDLLNIKKRKQTLRSFWRATIPKSLHAPHGVHMNQTPAE